MSEKAMEAAARAVSQDGFGADWPHSLRTAQAAITAYLAALEAGQAPLVRDRLAEDWWHPKHYGPSWRESPAVKVALERMEAEGFVIVPVEPSEGMLDAFVSRALQVSIHGEGGWSEYGRNQWQQMLAARPQIGG